MFVGCGQENESHSVESGLNTENISIDLVFKDQYIVCYLSEQTDLSCRNKNEVFPIFMNLQDESGEQTIKILPMEELTVSVDNLSKLERKTIELWDECRQPNSPSSCRDLDID